MDGILNVDKPRGKTSFSIVSMVKRLSRERRVGHAGTLDPMATGVLPVCIGQGTRVVEYLASASKSYRAEIEFGVTTDTYDCTGNVTFRGDSSTVNREKLEAVLSSFHGIIEQIPPMYSAIKQNGQPLYKLARAGINVFRQSRPVEIYRIEMILWELPVVTLEVECSKGTYIRSLAHDVGQILGCGASLRNLIRLRCGPFHIGDSITIPQLEEAFRHGYWEKYVYPLDTVLADWPAVVVDEEKEQDIINGRSILLSRGSDTNEPVEYGLYRAYSRYGRFLAVLKFNAEKGEWHPQKVFLTNT